MVSRAALEVEQSLLFGLQLSQLCWECSLLPAVVEAPDQLVSELRCELGRPGALPLGEEPGVFRIRSCPLTCAA